MMKVLQYIFLINQADAIQVEIRAAVSNHTTNSNKVYHFDCEPLADENRHVRDKNCDLNLSAQREHPFYIGGGVGRSDWCRVCGFDTKEFIIKYKGQLRPSQGILQGRFCDGSDHVVCPHCVDLQKQAQAQKHPKEMMFMTSLTNVGATGGADEEHTKSIDTMINVFKESYPDVDYKEHLLIPTRHDSENDYISALKLLAERGGCNVLWMQDHSSSAAFHSKKVQRLLSSFMRIGLIKRIAAVTCNSRCKIDRQIEENIFEDSFIFTNHGGEDFELARKQCRPKVFLFDSGKTSICTDQENGLHFRWPNEAPSTILFLHFRWFLAGAQILETKLGESIEEILFKGRM